MGILKPLDPDDSHNKKPSKMILVSNIIVISIIAFYGILTFLFVSNYKNIFFALRRPDIMEAARKVEDEESKQIRAKIVEAKKQTLEKILSPLVVINDK